MLQAFPKIFLNHQKQKCFFGIWLLWILDKGCCQTKCLQHWFIGYMNHLNFLQKLQVTWQHSSKYTITHIQILQLGTNFTYSKRHDMLTASPFSNEWICLEWVTPTLCKLYQNSTATHIILHQYRLLKAYFSSFKIILLANIELR